ncbi:WG repeat-containing protein [Leptospira mayottensis]|uniref:WG repeat-containing protein n=2 Tax=Leptospira mayottensis TaxID=1137606 RepID=A0A343URY3_9LEPT|nr:WG repeat-containing protein [Leptospira mayottensis]AVH81556.1 hypothetical protein [Leptospira mayottensis 200901116]
MRYLSTLVVLFCLLQCRPDDPRRQEIAGPDLLPGAYQATGYYADKPPEEGEILFHRYKFSEGKLPIQFDLVSDFYNERELQIEHGFIMSRVTGYIDTMGNVTIEPKFRNDSLPIIDQAGPFREGLAVITQHHYEHVMEDCERRTNIYETCFPYDFIDTRGKIVSKRPYQIAEEFSDGMAAVRLNSKNSYGYINKEGKMIIPEVLESMYDFNAGIALVEKDGQKFYINKNGERVLSNIHYKDDLHPFCDGLAIVRKGGSKKYHSQLGTYLEGGLLGYMNTTGKVVIEPKFSDASCFSDGLAYVETSNGEKGYIDKTGKMRITFKKLHEVDASYGYSENFSDGLVFADYEDDQGRKRGFIDKSGKLIIDLTMNRDYQWVGSFSEGLAVVYTKDPNRRILFIDKTGKVAFDVNDINRKIWERFKKH